MNQKEFNAVVTTSFTGLMFGLWMHNLWAGFFMTFLLWSLSWVL